MFNVSFKKKLARVFNENKCSYFMQSVLWDYLNYFYCRFIIQLKVSKLPILPQVHLPLLRTHIQETKRQVTSQEVLQTKDFTDQS